MTGQTSRAWVEAEAGLKVFRGSGPSMLTCRCARKVSQRYTVQEKSNTAPKIRFSAGKSHIESTDAHIPMVTQTHQLLQRAPVPHRHASLRACQRCHSDMGPFRVSSDSHPSALPAVSQKHSSLSLLPQDLLISARIRLVPPSSLPARRLRGSVSETSLRILLAGLQLKDSGLLFVWLLVVLCFDGFSRESCGRLWYPGWGSRLGEKFSGN